MEEEKRITGIVYKISSPHTDKVYIGSTIRTLKQRLSKHKSDYKRYLKGNAYFITSFEIVKLGDSVIEEIETLQNITIDELHYREKYLIKNIDHVVNKVIPIITLDERYENMKNYRISHKEQINELKKQVMNCTCGNKITLANIARHNKSKKHLSYIASSTPPIININIQNLTINNK